MGGRAPEDEAESVWTPGGSQTGETEDLRYHINQRRGGVLGRLGSNGARNQQAGSAAHIQSGLMRSSGSHHVEQETQNDPNTQLLRRIEKLERERNLTGDIQEMINDSEPPFTEKILAEEFPEDFKMLSLKQYGGVTKMPHQLQKPNTCWKKLSKKGRAKD